MTIVTNPTEFSILRQKTGLSVEDLAEHLDYTPRTLWRYEKGDGQPRKTVLHRLKELGTPENVISFQADKFRFIDLFAGIGGLRRGFDAIGGKCVFTSEWDRFAQETYRANYPQDDHDVMGDIQKIDAADIPKHDVLLAGFPCQPFSIAGISKKNSLGRASGFRCEAQGTLFFDVARILEHHKPKAFLLENVKNLINHDKGNTFKVIFKTLKEELGYEVVRKRVIDAKCLVPQHRERIFIVGFRDKNDFSLDDLELPAVSYGPKLKSILHPEDGSEKAEGHFTTGRRARISDKYTLSDHLWQYLQDYAEKHRQKGNGFGFGLVGPDDIARTLSARYYKDGSEILIEQKGKKNPRRLTPRECARLMGFDASGESKFKIPVSDTQAYKQFGNAVVSPVAAAIARHMSPWIVDKETCEVGENPETTKAVYG